jgi:hypothetical protein
VLRVGEQMDRGKNFMACLRGAVNGGAEKRKDRVLHENVMNVQDPCFFLGRLIAWPRRHAPVFSSKVVLPALQHFLFGRAALSPSIIERL